MIHYKNNTESTLAAGITDSDLTLSVGTSDGDLFPVITSPDVFLVTLSNQTGFEIVKVTARVDNVFTIERAQEGTTAKAFAMGDKVQMFITAGHFEDLRDNSLRYDSLPTDPIAGLNAEKIDGIRSNEFHLKRTNLTLLDPLILDFGSSNREEIVLNKQYAGVDNEWEKVVLLLSMSGANNSTVFTDSSIQQNTITGFGNAKISTAQFKFGSSSAYFDGSGDYLRLPYTSNLSLQGDFTVEAWFNVTTFTGGPILSKDTYGSNFDFSLQVANSTTLACYTNSTNSNLTVTVPAMSTGTWYHVAFVRYNGTNTFYLNGTSYGSNSMSITNASQSYLTIGCFGWNNPNVFFNGYIQDLRITKSARYTSNFTPPSSPFTTSSWTDQTYDPYYLNTALLLHFDGTSGSQAFTDNSVTPKSITAYGNAQISSTQSKFGGTSGYFDGTGDYLKLGVALFSSEDFTIECWIYLTAYQTDTYGNYIYCQYDGDHADRWAIGIQDTTHRFFMWKPGNSIVGTTAVGLNTWYHIVASRFGNTGYVFLNGNLEASGAFTGSVAPTLSTIGGAVLPNNTPVGCLNGYLDELRITKGIARYTSSFTPASLPYADIKNLTVDQYLDKVSLLMHFNGQNLSTSFTDSSPNQKAMTRTGDARISTTESKFGGSSGYFDGASDWLTTPGTSDLSFGTGDFTIEFWANSDDISANSKYVFGTDTTGCWQIAFNGSQAGKIGIARHNITWDAEYTHNLASHTWAHFAIVRLNGVLTFYKDGTSIGSGSNSLAYNAGTTFYVGGHASTGFTTFNGYLDEIRITKGVARYTTSFTPPPVPFVDGNKTISIGTQSNTLYQRSSGNFAWYKDGSYSGIDLDPGVNGSVRMVLNEAGNLLIGKTTDNGEGLLQVNGTISASSLNISGASNVNASHLGGVPSASYVRTDYDSIIKDPYTLSFGSGSREVLYLSKQAYPDVYFSYVKLLLHCDGTNNSTTVLDSSLLSNVVTCYNNAKLSTTQSKFGASSLVFDGTDDYAEIPNSSDFDFGNGNFTIEFWAYVSNTSGYLVFINKGYYPSTDRAPFLCYGQSNGSTFTPTFYASSTGASWDVMSGLAGPAASLNAWHHIAVVRNGNTFTIYTDGVGGTPLTSSATLMVNSDNIKLGCNDAITEELNGYLDEIRITKGIARYTANFTPDVIPFPDYVSGNDYDPYYGYVSLLLHGIGNEGGTLFYDSSPTPKTATVAGNTSTRTAQFKFPASSIYFDGTGDYLSFANDAAFNMGSGDFTIECWINFSAIASSGGYNNIICKRYLYNSNSSYILFYAGTGSIVFDASFNGTGSGVSSSYSIIPTLNTWYHLAAVRSGSSLILYVNGVPGTTGNAGSSSLYTNTEALKIGTGDYNNGNNLNGYIQDVRITKGIARYTAAFNPPARLFPDRASLLLDPYYDKVSLLMHFHGANASTSFIDSSLSAAPLTAYGNAQISTTQSKFGGSSAYFDGSGDYLQLDDSEYFNFGSGDFTIEMWIYPTALPSSGYYWSLISQRTSVSSNLAFSFYLSPTGIPECTISNSGSASSGTYAIVNSGLAVSTNSWTHLAVTRASGTLRIFQNGILKNTNASANFTIYNSTTSIKIGAFDTPPWANSYFTGYMDEIRVTKGIARYTSDFLVPQAPFADAPVVYSLGAQNGGMYSRSSTGRFDWYLSGNHSPIPGNPGVNGSTLMTLFSNSATGSTSLSLTPKNAGDAAIEIGKGRAVDGYSYIDFVGDSTYSDYGLRIIRNNSGANTTSYIYHCGTGDFSITAIHAAALSLQTTSTERLRITSGGRVLIGAGTDDSTNLLQVNGNLAFIGSSRRIVGDFSNATVSSRTIVQTSTSNGNTGVFFIPNGSGSASYLMPMNGSDPANCGYLILGVNASTCQIGARKQGSGTTVPLAFDIDGSEKMRLDTSGNLGIGVSPSTPLHVYRSTVSAEVRLEGGSTSGSVNTSAINFYQSSTNQWQISKRSSGWGGRANNFEISYYNGSWTDKLGITTAGRVGIGHTLVQSGTIDNLLHLYSTGYDGLKIEVANGTDSGACLMFSVGNEGTFGHGAILQLNGTSHSTYPDDLWLMNRTSAGWLRLGTNDTLRLSITNSGRILIGTSTDGGYAKLTICNGSEPAAPWTDSVVHIVGPTEAVTRLTLDCYSTSNQCGAVSGRRCRGTVSAPTAVQADDNLFGISGSGYSDTWVNSSKVSILFAAAQTWSATATGTYISLKTTPNDTITALERMRITDSGRILIGTITDDGYAKLTISGGDTPVTPHPDVVLQIVNSNTTARFLIDTHSDTVSSVITGRRSRGTASAPTAVQADTDLLSITGTGYSNTWVNSARAMIRFSSAQTWTATANGTYIAFHTTQNDAVAHSERLRITDSGRILIGTTTDDGTNLLQVNGDQAFIGSSRRIRGDFSNATLGSRTLFQTSTSNQPTHLAIIPNGTAVLSSFGATNSSDTSNFGYMSVGISDSYASVVSGIAGSGTYLPIAFFTSSSERMRLSTGGRLLIGTVTDDATNTLQVNGSIVQSPLASVTPTNNGELVFEATSNTTITVKYKGSDGTVRTGTITLT